MASISALNQELLRALGFGDIKGVTGMLLQISNDRPPVVTVQRVIFTDTAAVADQLTTVRERYELKPEKLEEEA
jgi:hypothetical protein